MNTEAVLFIFHIIMAHPSSGCNLLVPLAKEQSLMQCCVSMVQMEKFIFQAWL